MFDSINEYVQKCCFFSPGEIDLFNALLQYKEIPRKTFLLQEGQVCNFEYYLNKGCIRNFYLDEQGDEVTLQFAIEGWWVSDIASFQEQKPSHMFIESLEHCEVLMLSSQSKEKLLQEVPKFERVFRLMVQRNLSGLQERLFKTIATTATEKYLDFLDRYPTIPQRVAQHYIASYLGFSPEFLSKVRTRLSRK